MLGVASGILSSISLMIVVSEVGHGAIVASLVTAIEGMVH